MAAKMVLLIAVCILFPAFIAATRPMANPFTVVGKIYCDTCGVGFETSASTYIHGAKVRVECRHRNTQEVLYSVEGITDRTGTYRITVKEDQEDKLCDAVLVSSPMEGCRSADPGRDRSRVILTRYNGMTSDVRFANALGFLKDQPMSECDMVLQQYQELED